MNKNILAGAIQSEEFIRTFNSVKKITDKMTNDFFFQDNWFKNFVYICMLPIWTVFGIIPPREAYCQFLTKKICEIHDKNILYNFEFNKLIHAAWIKTEYKQFHWRFKSEEDLFDQYLKDIHIDNNILLKNKIKRNALIKNEKS